MAQLRNTEWMLTLVSVLPAATYAVFTVYYNHLTMSTVNNNSCCKSNNNPTSYTVIKLHNGAFDSYSIWVSTA